MSNKALVITSLIALAIVGVVLGSDLPGGAESFDPATVTCNNTSLTSQAVKLMEGATSPLLGSIKVFKSYDFRSNNWYQREPFDFMKTGNMSQKQIQQEMLADRKHQCAASLVTNRGQMVMYYGWKVVGGSTYIEAMARPDID